MITVTQSEFEATQNHIRKLLEDVYAIKNQSKGKIEYAAARALGYNNHLQLKVGIKNGIIPVSLYEDKYETEDELFTLVTSTKREPLIEFMIDGLSASDFNYGEIRRFLIGDFELPTEKITDGLIERIKAFANQGFMHTVKFYKDQAAYDAHEPEELTDGLYFKSDVADEMTSLLAHCYQEGGIVSFHDYQHDDADTFDSREEIENFIKLHSAAS